MSRIQIELIDRYLSGDSSSEESAIVERWLAESRTCAALVTTLQDNGTYEQPLSCDVSFPKTQMETLLLESENITWARITQRTAHTPVSDTDPARHATTRFQDKVRSSSVSSRIRWTAFVPIAAAVVLLTLVVGNSWHKDRTVSNQALHTYTTNAGQRERITLPDGSTALLNAGSTLRYGAGFGSAHRDVQLMGEAVFTVVHSEGTPFIVKTGFSSTRVLGTVFSVRHYPTEPQAKVTVVEGRLNSTGVILSVGDAMTIDRNGTTSVRHGVNIASELAWTDGRLVFYLTPLGEAIADLERWYGISIQVTNPHLLKREISTTLYRENAAQAIALIEAALHVTATWHGRVVTLSPEATH